MKFKQVKKKIFYYSNKENVTVINHHIIENIRPCSEYTILFNSLDNQTSSSYAEIILHFKNFTQSHSIVLNKSYTFQNKNFTTIEINIFLKDDILFNITVLEKPIQFKENTYENSIKITNFIRNIDNLPNVSKISYKKSNLKIACILDEFTYECISYEANLLQLKSMYWLNQISEFKPDILLVESAWYGVCKTWIKKIAICDKIDDTLLEIIKYCNKRDIPTIFFNKEGLVNFNYFEKNSSLFDFIFVSDENIISRQKKSCKHNRVYPLSFACQPQIHNSINKNKFKLGDIAFAGGWYGDKHLDRLNDFEYIIKPALNYNFDIYDRNYHQRSILEFMDEYWPSEYLNNIVGKLDYKYMIEAYKNYTLFLNVNSVQDSSYMVSRRVYEILACKTLLLSSFSLGIFENFKDYILISRNKEETISIIEDVLCFENIDKYQKKSKKSQRYVLENHTYGCRLREILNLVKVNSNSNNINLSKYKSIDVGIIYIVKSHSHLEKVFSTILNQTCEISEIFLLIDKDIKINDYLDYIDKYRIYCRYYSSATDIDNLLKEIYDLNQDTSYYALMSSPNFYHANYIRDYINILTYVNSDVIGKSCIYNFVDCKLEIEKYDFKDSYVNKLCKDTIFFSRYFLSEFKYSDYFDKEYIYSCEPNLYSDDEFNFIKNAFSSSIIEQKYLDFIQI